MQSGSRQPASLPVGGQWLLDQVQVARRVRPFGDGAFGQYPAEHVVDRPGDRRHRRDPQSLEDLGAARVVDAGYHVRDLVGLTGYAGTEDVGVVAAGNRGESGRMLRPGFVEVVPVEPEAGDPLSWPVGRQPPERARQLVDDGDRVAGVGQLGGQSRAGPPAPDDDDVHDTYRTPGSTPAQLASSLATVTTRAAVQATRRSGASPGSLLALGATK